MKRKIVGYQQDEVGDWCAALECGHGRHMRHNPPWEERPWVLTPEGRQRHLGIELDCRKCDAEGEDAPRARSDAPE